MGLVRDRALKCDGQLQTLTPHFPKSLTDTPPAAHRWPTASRNRAQEGGRQKAGRTQAGGMQKAAEAWQEAGRRQAGGMQKQQKAGKRQAGGKQEACKRQAGNSRTQAEHRPASLEISRTLIVCAHDRTHL